MIIFLPPFWSLPPLICFLLFSILYPLLLSSFSLKNLDLHYTPSTFLPPPHLYHTHLILSSLISLFNLFHSYRERTVDPDTTTTITITRGALSLECWRWPYTPHCHATSKYVIPFSFLSYSLFFNSFLSLHSAPLLHLLYLLSLLTALLRYSQSVLHIWNQFNLFPPPSSHLPLLFSPFLFNN